MRNEKAIGSQLTILILSILLLTACFGAFYEFFFKPFRNSLNNIAFADDAERARQLCDYVSQRIKSGGKSLLETNYSSVFWSAGRNSARLEICGITNTWQQEQIFATVKEWQATNQNLSKIRLEFFESDEPRGQYGQHINILREEYIVLTNAQSGVIFNQVAPKN